MLLLPERIMVLLRLLLLLLERLEMLQMLWLHHGEMLGMMRQMNMMEIGGAWSLELHRGHDLDLVGTLELHRLHDSKGAIGIMMLLVLRREVLEKVRGARCTGGE